MCRDISHTDPEALQKQAPLDMYPSLDMQTSRGSSLELESHNVPYHLYTDSSHEQNTAYLYSNTTRVALARRGPGHVLLKESFNTRSCKRSIRKTLRKRATEVAIHFPLTHFQCRPLAPDAEELAAEPAVETEFFVVQRVEYRVQSG